jgi:transportin-1
MSSKLSILEVLEDDLNKKDITEIAFESFVMLLKDSNNFFDEKTSQSLNQIIVKILFYLKTPKNELCHTLINILYTFLDSCQGIALSKMREIIPILKQYANSSDPNIRNIIGKCWLIVIKLDKTYVDDYYEDLFNFYLTNFNDCIYLHSFVSAKFFQFVINSEDNFIQHNKIKECLRLKVGKLVSCLLQNMKLTDNDINYFDNIFQNEKTSISNSNSNSSNNNSGSHSNSSGSNNNSSGSDSGDDDNGGTGTTNTGGSGSNSQQTNSQYSQSGYNPDQTLRKKCSRILDKLSHLFPQETFCAIRPLLENDIQSTEDMIKERSILAFGAIANGSYQQVIEHLRRLAPFLIRELQHPNKFVRAIACWTLSRYTKYIMVDNYFENKNDLFKEYLREILKKILDKENLVRESAGSAFKEMIYVNKTLVEPYLFDVLKIIMNVFEKYTGRNLLIVYDILILIMDNYSSLFKNQNFVEDMTNCIKQKWYELVKNNDFLTLPSFFDVIITLIRVSGDFLVKDCKYFLSGCMKIIEQYINEFKINSSSLINFDRELLTKSLNTISNLCQRYPEYIKGSSVKKNIVEFLFEIMNIKDLYIIHYAIALFGDLIITEPILLQSQIDNLFKVLIPLINLQTAKNEIQSEKISVCNNSIWTIGLSSIHYPLKTMQYIDVIMEKFGPILILPKVSR